MPRKLAATLENNAWRSRKRVVADYVPARRDEAVMGGSCEDSAAHCLLGPSRRRYRVVAPGAGRLCGAMGCNAGGHELGHNQQGPQGGGAAFVLHAL
jgi:hypothetical protein